MADVSWQEKEIDDDDIKIVTSVIGGDWIKLSYALFKMAKMDSTVVKATVIEKLNQDIRLDLQDKCKEMLEMWKEKMEETASKGKLIKALKDISKNRIAKTLDEKNNSKNVPIAGQVSNPGTQQSTSDMHTSPESIDGITEDWPYDVNVEVCTLDFYKQHKDESYPMTKQIRGNACIINVHTITPNDGKDQPPPRIGTDHDRDKMKELLDQLKFNVTVYNDSNGLNAEEIKQKLKAFSELGSHAEADCCVVVVLSHGKAGNIQGTDGQFVKINHIIQLFDNKTCPKLKGKPKLFFFQACRGDEYDTSVADDATSFPSLSDTLVGFPTLPGYVAFRKPEEGSWYIQTLVKVVMKYAKTDDLCAMLNRVFDIKMTSFGKAYVIITGASKGFGRWLAIEMNTKMGKGSKMVLMGRDEDKLAGIKAEVSKNSEVEAITVSLELADKAKVKDTFTSILASETVYEKAILINNAAAVNDVSRSACELWLDGENTDNYTQVNISSFLCMTAMFLKHFKLDAHTQPTVVNVSSACATFPIPSLSLYSGSKAARDIIIEF